VGGVFGAPHHLDRHPRSAGLSQGHGQVAISAREMMGGHETRAAAVRDSRHSHKASASVMLFSTRSYGGGTQTGPLGRQYDVAPDGRFLINTMLDAPATPITLIKNWNPDVKK